METEIIFPETVKTDRSIDKDIEVWDENSPDETIESSNKEEDPRIKYLVMNL